MSMSEIAAAGAQRISLGGALTWVAVGAMAAAAERMRHGDFSSLGVPVQLDEWFNAGAR
jgi:hypothetical protein